MSTLHAKFDNSAETQKGPDGVRHGFDASFYGPPPPTGAGALGAVMALSILCTISMAMVRAAGRCVDHAVAALEAHPGLSALIGVTASVIALRFVFRR
jgi:hypothetical protein